VTNSQKYPSDFKMLSFHGWAYLFEMFPVFVLHDVVLYEK